MLNILDLLQNSMTGKMVEELDKEVGINDRDKTSVAVDNISKMILAGVNRNARTPEGLQSLNNALEKDHNGSVFDDVMGNLLNRDAKMAAGNERMLNGAGILRHVLGGQESSAFDSLSKATNMDKSQLMSLAVKVAPFILGALGKAKKEEGLGASGVGSLLEGVMGSLSSQKGGQASFLNSILDQDGDGEIMDDVTNIGKKIFGNFFKK